MKIIPWSPLRHALPKRFVLIVFVSVIACLSPATAGVTATYANDFTDPTEDFTFAAEARWFHIPATGVYSNEFRSTTGTAGCTVTNLGGMAFTAKPFSVTAAFTLLDGNGTASFVGLCFLSGGESLPATDGYTFRQVIATPASTGISLSLRRNNVEMTNGTSFTQLRFEKGTPLQLTVRGVYVDSNADGVNDALDLTASIENPQTGQRSTLVFRDADPLVGKAFGMKAYDANTVTSSILWDAFSVSNDTPRGTVLTVR